jgi:hypothetical protein
MNYYAGIDVSLEASSVCVIDGSGKIVREAKVASEPAALIAWFGSLGLSLTRIGLEAGPLSQWLYAALRDAGLAVGDAARAQWVEDHAGEDGPQGRARHCRTDAAGLVSSGALQVDGGRSRRCLAVNRCGPQSSRISRSALVRVRKRRAKRPSPCASSRSANSRGTRA